ncbi:DUF4012 domain-containing protein [Pseudarthrobacter oxydans]|uniref:DUF4012 domain-containing protein n=1 Tax=Pseudarthrobacter oxydans TaxID=1671 RepID=UPI00343434FD
MIIFVIVLLVFSWLAVKASVVKSELETAKSLLPELQIAISENNTAGAAEAVDRMTVHTAAAREAGSDPIWSGARSLPLIGANFAAVSEMATAADDVTRLGAAPLAEAFQALDWESLVPNENGVDWKALNSQLPKVRAAAYAVRTSEERLRNMNSDGLIKEIATPLREAVEQLASIRRSLDTAADVAGVVPGMMGEERPRTYLLMVQNNAEARASGGIPGALAELVVENGKLSLGVQKSASEVGIMSPVLELDPEERQIYSTRPGKFMQDVNMTPDFPSTAALADAMWERTTGKRVDGVISVDPVALGYILDATGPVAISDPSVAALSNSGLPTELSAANVVSTLLSDVYSKIEEPKLQDAYFAGVAQEIFAALTKGDGDPKKLLQGLSLGAQERRILVWSASSEEQSSIARYPLSGAVTGPSVAPAQFGVYFNDGTGAKMDYYVKRTVQLIKECPKDGYEQTTVRVTSTNSAPADAATSLPAYVTGDGVFGVPPGSVQTNIVAYGPVQAQVEMAKLDGQKTEFAPYFHGNRPVGILAIRLAPGESKTVDFTFGKIVQHTEPNVVVTPTVQDVKDVTLPTESFACG